MAKIWVGLSGFLCRDDVSVNQRYNEITVLLTPSLNSLPMCRHIEIMSMMYLYANITVYIIYCSD